MSASPPPPPPYATVSTPERTPAWDRRALRDQRRAMALQVQQQRAFQRAQLRAGRRTSMLGPVLLMAVGVMFLLVEMGRVQPAGLTLWLGHWWPLILVVAGFVLLLEWATDTWIFAQRGVDPPRRTVGAGTGFLLVLLALAGISVMSVANRPDWISRNWNPELVDAFGLDRVFTPHIETQRDFSAPLAAKGVLTIRNYHGNITVTGASQDGQVHVSAHQRMAAWQGNELKAKEQRDQPVLQQDGNGLLLKANGEGRDRTDLTIEMPHESGIIIEPEKGDINVTEVRGPLTIHEHSGNVTMTALTGDVHITQRDDNAAITGHSLSGDFVLNGRTGDLALSDVSGSVHLQGDFFGTTHLERIKGPVHFQSSFTEFACTGIPGEFNVEGRDELEANDLSGPVVLHTSNRNLTLTSVRNGATIDDRNGSVTLSLADPIGPVKVTTAAASIDLKVPDRASFALLAETSGGQIINDLGLSPQSQGDHGVLSGRVRAGGPQIALRTTNGDIHVHKASTEAQAQDAKEQPDTDAEETIKH